MRFPTSAIALLLALASGGCASSATNAAAPIRVLVYNIHAGTDAARVNNLERVAALVKQSLADIVMLQEVDSATRRSGNVDQTARLASLTGYYGVFGRAIDFDGGKYGVAVLSRWPIVADTMIELPVRVPPDSAAGYEARGALVTVIDGPGGHIRAVNTHLDAYRSEYRIQQARALVASVLTDSRSTIVGGDFNSEPVSGVLGILGDAGLRDAFAECGIGSGLTFPADIPVKRIDFLLLPDGVRCARATVPDSQASDHRPVLFEVMFPRPR